MMPKRTFPSLLLKSLFFVMIASMIIFTGFTHAEGRDPASSDISPVGTKIANDKQGHTIYQVDANGIKIGYELVGSGPSLLMLNGLGNTIADWDPRLIDMLSEKHQLILMDTRGMGYSTANEVPFSEALMANDVIALLDALGVQKTDLLGYSMGSSITQATLYSHSERLKKVIMVAPSIEGSPVVAQLEKAIAPRPLTILPITVQRDIEMTRHWKTPLEKLPSITNQTMFIVGMKDVVVFPESSSILANQIPGSWLIRFPNNTHSITHESPVELTKCVLTFLDIN